jgi:hypothetical protein
VLQSFDIYVGMCRVVLTGFWRNYVVREDDTGLEYVIFNSGFPNLSSSPIKSKFSLIQ